jgi:hypothetical protein
MESTAYPGNLIKRFSEDCDLTLNKSWLGLQSDPAEEAISGKERSRRIEQLVSLARNCIKEIILPTLIAECRKYLSDKIDYKLILDPQDPDQLTILFYYPTTLQFSDILELYVKPYIRLEFGARGGMEPHQLQTITPYIAEILPGFFEHSSCQIPTLALARTFWEKVTILHSLYHRHLNGKTVAKRMFRHYYDLYMFVVSNEYQSPLLNHQLLKEVVLTKTYLFKDNNASYHTAVLGSINLYPLAEMITYLKKDYQEMLEMIAKPQPKFEVIMQAIAELEQKINQQVHF